MKTTCIILLLGAFFTMNGCKKAKSGNSQEVIYIAYFQKDSLAAFIKSPAVKNTPGLRDTLKNYALKILKEKSNAETAYKSSFFNTASSNGFIVDIPDDKKVAEVKADKRIDSLHRDLKFNGF
jgi:hypothetical protein